MRLTTGTLPLVFLVSLSACGGGEPPPPLPPDVRVAPATSRDVPVYGEFTGETRGAEDVEILARVAGFLQQVAYTEGAPVRKGDLLFVIDPRPFEASLARANADLAEAEARFNRATIQVNRLRPLAAMNAVSQQDLDNAIANEAASQAGVDAARAQVTQAELDLSYTRVVSPIDGLADRRRVDVGSFVGSGQPTLLTIVSDLDPIRFDFSISEAEYLTYTREAAATGRRSGEGRVSGIALVLADGSVHDHTGQISIIGRGVDRATGTLPVQAVFPNPDGVVRPGQFARARVPLRVRTGAILVPQKAVIELQGTYSVYVVGADSTVELRPVTTANREGTEWVITEGLLAGEQVIVDGVQKVRAGVKVRPMAATDSTAGTR